MLVIFSLLYAYARPIIKWFLRRFTRLCELQRICYGSENGSKRKKEVEQSLSLSRKPKIKELISQLDNSITNKITVADFQNQLVPHVVTTILKVKRVKPKIHPDFGPTLGACIESIWSYRRLCNDVEDIRKISFDNRDTDHENKLLKLWRLLKPEEQLEKRVSKQWQDIGFQGDDPMTDFRGKQGKII